MEKERGRGGGEMEHVPPRDWRLCTSRGRKMRRKREGDTERERGGEGGGDQSDRGTVNGNE